MLLLLMLTLIKYGRVDSYFNISEKYRLYTMTFRVVTIIKALCVLLVPRVHGFIGRIEISLEACYTFLSLTLIGHTFVPMRTVDNARGNF